MQKLLYLFSSSRKSRLDRKDKTDYPWDLFYGIQYFRQKGYIADILERQIPNSLPISIRYVLLSLQNHILAKLIRIGISTPFFLNKIATLNSYDTLIGGQDSIALALGYYKKKKWIKSKVVFIGMGLAARLSQAKSRQPLFYRLFMKRYFGKILEACDAIVTLGKAEKEYYSSEFPLLQKKVHFIPFGVDTKFWTPDTIAKTNGGPMLFVGSDLNKNYGLLIKIASSLKDVPFVCITSRISQNIITSNVKLICSDWHRELISDIELREYYRKSTAVIIPLKESLQPSGQSVALQAMACGSPVIITKTGGFWEPEQFTHLKHCIFIYSNTVDEWSKNIRLLLENENLRSTLSRDGRCLVEERYTSDLFAKRLEELIVNL
jgi:glycosyltransferase involved in cell wall biosynthesis